MRHRPGISLTAAAVTLAMIPSVANATIWDDDGPWGAYGWDAQSKRFHQPELASPIPAAAALGTYDDGDFDEDGIANRTDNCLLVANPGQQPAARPQTQAERRAYRRTYGPPDLLRLSRGWDRRHPQARFRDDADLGEACSGYNGNYLRTTKALIDSSNSRKLEVFRFLGEAGPMFGGAARPFPNGRPADYDRFGTVPGSPAPAPTPQDELAQDRNGNLARGNMTPSMPICSGYEQYAGFFGWLTMLGGALPPDDGLRAQYESYEDELGCNSDFQRGGWSAAMHHFWAGKRLYTNARGGRITNRFVASVTENPVYAAGLKVEPFNSLAERTGAHPYADEPDTSGQSRHGIIFEAKSYIDGREAIVMDWRGFEAAWPLGQGTHIDGLFGLLIYDECRAIQTGVYNCTAVTDWAISERRHTLQEGYMPWIAKGPPSIDEYIDATS